MWDGPRPAATLRPMNARLRALTLLIATVATVFALAVAPAVAASEGGGAGEENGKISLPSTQRDQFGLVILGISGVFALGALVNASKQLKGSRPQTDGRIRWR